MLSSCTVQYYTDLNTKKVRDFRKEMISKNNNIEKIIFEYGNSQLEILYQFKKEVSLKNKFIIFDKTKKLLVDQEFKNEFLKKYFRKYKGEGIYYPKVRISFDFPTEESIELEFISEYYEVENKQTGEKKIRVRDKWVFENYSKEIIDLPGGFSEVDYIKFLNE